MEYSIHHNKAGLGVKIQGRYSRLAAAVQVVDIKGLGHEY